MCAASSNAFGAPAVRTSKTFAASNDTLVGEGEHQYKVDHQFCKLPDKFKWQVTHNVAVDSNNNLYVIHEGLRHLKDHPSIFVFDSDGKFIRAFGSQFQGGGHGIEVRKEDGEEYLYVAAYQGVKSFAKMTLKGEILWYKRAPIESGVYKDNEHLATEAGWDRKSFLPTNFAFLDNGGFLLADGYGSYFIHEFDKDVNWVRCFGGPGEEAGQFQSRTVCGSIDAKGKRRLSTSQIAVVEKFRSLISTASILRRSRGSASPRTSTRAAI